MTILNRKTVFILTLLLTALSSQIAMAGYSSSTPTTNVHMINESGTPIFWGFATVYDPLDDMANFTNDWTHISPGHSHESFIMPGPSTGGGVIPPTTPGESFQSAFIHFGATYYRHEKAGHFQGHHFPHFSLFFSWNGGSREYDFVGQFTDQPGLTVYPHDAIGSQPVTAPTHQPGQPFAPGVTPPINYQQTGLVVCTDWPASTNGLGNMATGFGGSTTFTITFKNEGSTC